MAEKLPPLGPEQQVWYDWFVTLPPDYQSRTWTLVRIFTSAGHKGRESFMSAKKIITMMIEDEVKAMMEDMENL